LREGDEVALMPPVSGGSAPPGRLHEGPLSVDAVLAEAAKEGAGAAVAFLGLVREGPSKWVPGESVTRLEFEAYEPMAEQELSRLAEEARGRFGLVDARILHRLGTLGPGEAIVLVLVTAPHRAAAFDAAAWIMDRMKTVVPIWKKEAYASGSHHWVEEGAGRRA
ncbi:MAG TPA: molybdenum cofactor biosynthesis protein MoaE, partial [Candidatus Thermoplasmatota archaeon]|nr:molybdenum cofactor biosynthesis protein MoaE [Candidatus Thermoplasmatota archaeon]